MGLDFGFLLRFPSRFLISGRRFQLISTDFHHSVYEISTVASASQAEFYSCCTATHLLPRVAVATEVCFFSAANRLSLVTDSLAKPDPPRAGEALASPDGHGGHGGFD